jgi:hypothetical protein
VLTSNPRPEPGGTELELRVGSQNRLFEYSAIRTSRFISGGSLIKRINGFGKKAPLTLMLAFPHQGFRMYSSYRGGKAWVPKLPINLGSPGDILTAQVTVPNPTNFLDSLPGFTLANEIGMRWMSDSADLVTSSSFGRVNLRVMQDPPLNDISEFETPGEAIGEVEFAKGSAYLDIRVTGAVGNSRILRLYHDGRHSPRIGIRVGREFSPVFFISSDGARLRWAYRDCKFNPHVAILYLVDPTTLYQLGESVTCSIPDGIEGVTSAFRVDQIRFLRSFESLTQRVGTTYDVGRLGAEIAFAVAKLKLGLTDIELVEPSQPGVDLFSHVGGTVIQARLLVEGHHLARPDMENMMKRQLADMLRALRRDMKRIRAAHTGHVMLSVTSIDWITRTIVLTVTRQPS